MGPILPEFPPTIIHLIFCDRSIKQGPSIIVDGISKWKEGKLQNHYKISNNDESQILTIRSNVILFLCMINILYLFQGSFKEIVDI